MSKMDARAPRRLEVPPLTRSGIGVRFWGTRGSFAVPGPGTLVYGGNTPCIEVSVEGRVFIIDGGTGIAALGNTLVDTRQRSFDILLSHLHHDHIIGLPFFRPFYDARRQFRIYAGNLKGRSPESELHKMFSPPLFPIELDQKAKNIAFVGFRSGETLKLEGDVTVRTVTLRHPSGATGYRFDAGGRAIAYVCDFEHAGPTPEPNIVDFVHRCDLVIYDTMYTIDDYLPCKGWGHSTIEAGLALCAAAGAKRLAAFHHNPDYDDAKLARIERILQKASPHSFCAREGQTLNYAAPASVAPASAL
jgi:phosphoribosyl 1,2-cyclic phosphodiesterase